jgi:hypothetical protein
MLSLRPILPRLASQMRICQPPRHPPKLPPMDWYYAANNKQEGPVSEEKFRICLVSA